MNKEEIEEILEMCAPEYYRDGIRIFANQAGGVTIEGDQGIAEFHPSRAGEICEAITAMAKWTLHHCRTRSFIEDSQEREAPGAE